MSKRKGTKTDAGGFGLSAPTPPPEKPKKWVNRSDLWGVMRAVPTSKPKPPPVKDYAKGEDALRGGIFLPPAKVVENEVMDFGPKGRGK